MNASSESGLWATVISRTCATTDEEAMTEILPHFYEFDPCRWRHRRGFELWLRLIHRFVLRLDLRQRFLQRFIGAAQVPAQPPPHGNHGQQNGPQRDHQAD